MTDLDHEEDVRLTKENFIDGAVIATALRGEPRHHVISMFKLNPVQILALDEMDPSIFLGYERDGKIQRKKSVETRDAHLLNMARAFRDLNLGYRDVLTRGAYDKWAQDHGEPSASAIINVFDTWTNACKCAYLPVSPATRTYNVAWNARAIELLKRDFRDWCIDTNTRPSREAYIIYRSGEVEAPSITLVHRRDHNFFRDVRRMIRSKLQEMYREEVENGIFP